MLELPKSGFWRTSMEYITDWKCIVVSLVYAEGLDGYTFVETIHVQLPDERGYVGMFEVLPALH